jgi:folylpolyglutamate synthase/dihydropteroate synthase
MQDKAIADMLAALAPAVASIICTTAPSPRAAAAQDLAQLAAQTIPDVQAIEDPFDALRLACTHNRLVVVAGSIFLIGPLRERLARDILRSS